MMKEGPCVVQDWAAPFAFFGASGALKVKLKFVQLASSLNEQRQPVCAATIAHLHCRKRYDGSPLVCMTGTLLQLTTLSGSLSTWPKVGVEPGGMT